MTHDHTHPHPISQRLALSILLTSIIFIVEVIGGYFTGSLALLSDAAHVFMDVFALGLTWIALRIASLPPTRDHTYGFRRIQIMAAIINGSTLLIIAFEIVKEALQRFQNPVEIIAGPMLLIAVTGLAVNLLVAFVLNDHDHRDLNVQSAWLHVIGDAAASVGVILAAGVIYFTGWLWVDPLVSLLIGGLIVVSALRVLRPSLRILAEGVPGHLRYDEVNAAIQSMPAVEQVHDLHIWSLDSSRVALTAHLVVKNDLLENSDCLIAELQETLAQKFDIHHTTFQIECEHRPSCFGSCFQPSSD